MTDATQAHMLLPGTKTQWGTVQAVGYVGERYYWLLDQDGVVSMMPADMVEAKHE